MGVMGNWAASCAFAIGCVSLSQPDVKWYDILWYDDVGCIHCLDMEHIFDAMFWAPGFDIAYMCAPCVHACVHVVPWSVCIRLWACYPLLQRMPSDQHTAVVPYRAILIRVGLLKLFVPWSRPSKPWLMQKGEHGIAGYGTAPASLLLRLWGRRCVLQRNDWPTPASRPKTSPSGPRPKKSQSLRKDWSKQNSRHCRLLYGQCIWTAIQRVMETFSVYCCAFQRSKHWKSWRTERGSLECLRRVFGVAESWRDSVEAQRVTPVQTTHACPERWAKDSEAPSLVQKSE